MKPAIVQQCCSEYDRMHDQMQKSQVAVLMALMMYISSCPAHQTRKHISEFTCTPTISKVLISPVRQSVKHSATMSWLKLQQCAIIGVACAGCVDKKRRGCTPAGQPRRMQGCLQSPHASGRSWTVPGSRPSCACCQSHTHTQVSWA